MNRSKLKAWLIVAALVCMAIGALCFRIRDVRGFPNTGGNNWWYLPSTSPVANPTWNTQNWFIDGSNTSGCASDQNTGTCPGCGTCGSNHLNDGPLSTWHELHDHRWACLGGADQCPRVSISNTIAVNFLSNMQFTDQIYFNGSNEAGGAIALEGVQNIIQTGVILSSVTAKNRNTPQLLQANLGANGAVGQFVINTTHISGAWAIKNLGSNVFALSQPMVGATIPFGSIPAEVNTWANGDSVNLVQYPQVTIGPINPMTPGGVSTFYLFDLAINTSNPGVLNLDGTIPTFIEQCTFGQTANAQIVNQNPATSALIMVNDDIAGQAMNFTQYQASGTIGFYGGDIRTGQAAKCLDCSFDLDIALLSSVTGTFPNMGFAYLDTGVTLTALAGDTSGVGVSNVGPGPGALWGPGAVNLNGLARFTYTAGVDGGRSAFLETAGLQINGVTTGCVLSLDAGVTSCNVALSPANLDTNLGAATKCFGNLGGGSYCNGGL